MPYRWSGQQYVYVDSPLTQVCQTDQHIFSTWRLSLATFYVYSSAMHNIRPSEFGCTVSEDPPKPIKVLLVLYARVVKSKSSYSDRGSTRKSLCLLYDSQYSVVLVCWRKLIHSTPSEFLIHRRTTITTSSPTHGQISHRNIFIKPETVGESRVEKVLRRSVGGKWKGIIPGGVAYVAVLDHRKHLSQIEIR